jgi:hypothetical protein
MKYQLKVEQVTMRMRLKNRTNLVRRLRKRPPREEICRETGDCEVLMVTPGSIQ